MKTSTVLLTLALAAYLTSAFAGENLEVEYFPVDPPARSALGPSGPALGARTEIECIATVSD